MSSISKRAVKNLLKRYEVRPSKRFGQNFLIDKKVIKKVIEASKLSPNEIVLEIGPGMGALTQKLAKKVNKVITVEKDPKMVKILKRLLECWNIGNIEIVKGDILRLDPKSYTLKPYKIVANLPFYLTAPVIRKFLESADIKPPQMVLVVQKEVAQRICARPPEMNLLAVSVQFYAKPKIISYISKKSFWPSPKVDSAIIKITPSSKIVRENFFRVVRAGFSQPRKQLINNLFKNLKKTEGGEKFKSKEKVKIWLLKNNIQPSQRAETLNIKDWLKLTNNLSPS